MPFLIDASSWIEAWLRYPIQSFPRVWEWLAEEIGNGNIQTPKVICKEVRHKSEECGKWLDENGITYPGVSEDNVLTMGVEIKGIAGITGDIKDNPRGIDDNDLELIVVASLTDGTVVTEEDPQLTADNPRTATPPKPINYKIPFVCRLNEVKVTNFLEMIKGTGKTFG